MDLDYLITQAMTGPYPAALYTWALSESEDSVADERPQFVLGIKAEAERLRGLGIDVGEPLSNERYLKNPDGTDALSLQTTTKGLFLYDPLANIVHFFGAAGR